jgi:hypothetical protein
MANELYPNLPSSLPPEVQQRHKPNSVADALYPGPKPPPNWHREDISLIQRAIGQGQSSTEIAQRYGITKHAVELVRRLGR